MKLYKIKRTDEVGWDEFIGAIICVEDEAEAKKYRIGEDITTEEIADEDFYAKIEDVIVEYIGEAKEDLVEGVVLASFKAG